MYFLRRPHIASLKELFLISRGAGWRAGRLGWAAAQFGDGGWAYGNVGIDALLGRDLKRVAAAAAAAGPGT